MKCRRCNAEWTISDDFLYPSKCPYCGANIAFLSLFSVFKSGIDRYGLTNKKCLIAYLMDLLPQNPDELMSYKIMIQSGILDNFSDMKASDFDYFQRKIALTKKYLENNIGFRKEKVNFLIDSIYFAFGYESKVKNVKAGITKKTYKDADNVYFNLGQDAENHDKCDLAVKLYGVSADAGNLYAIRKLLDWMRRGFVSKCDERKFYLWNKALMDAKGILPEFVPKDSPPKFFNIVEHKPNDFELAAEQVAISKAYGIGTSIDIEEANGLIIKHRFISECGAEYIIRSLVELMPGGLRGKKVIDALLLKFNGMHPLCRTVYIYLCNNYDIDRLSYGEDIDELDLYEKDACLSGGCVLGNIEFVVAEYFRSNHKIEQAFYWYEEAITSYGNDNAFLRKIQICFHSKDKKIREFAAKEFTISNCNIGAPYYAYALAQQYFIGEAVSPNYIRMLEYLKEAANGELVPAMIDLGIMYFWGYGCDGSDIDKAIYWFEYAIKFLRLYFAEISSNYLRITVSYLICCYGKQLIKSSDRRSFEKLTILADYYHCKNAISTLKDYYYLDKDFHDMREAKRYRKMLDIYCPQGDWTDLVDCTKLSIDDLLWDIHENPLEIPIANEELAVAWYDEAELEKETKNCIDTYDDVDFELGIVISEYKGETDMERNHLVETAENLHSLHIPLAEKEALIGMSYYTGDVMGTPFDLRKGGLYMQKAYQEYMGDDEISEKNLIQLEFFLGIAYMTGIGAEKNKLKAVELWDKVLEKDAMLFSEAMSIIAMGYLKGTCKINSIQIEMESDYEKARAIVDKVLEVCEEPEAYFVLSEMYMDGHGAEKNQDKARKLYNIAINKNSHNAIRCTEGNIKEAKAGDNDAKKWCALRNVEF